MVKTRKSTRTISGVTPLAVMTAPYKCPGKCIYCPTWADAPQSYTPESPAVLRAKSSDFDAGRQVRVRLRMFEDMGHPTDKIELIIMGGTFLAQPVDYQYAFVKDCYDAMNGIQSTSLEDAKMINETALHRVTGLCIETRPDWCGQVEIERMLDFGTTRVELGVQMPDDDVYSLVQRGHSVKEVVTATALLRNHGFKVYYHWMPGLPGSTPEKDLELSRMLWTDERFRPDGIKLYPTMVVQNTELEMWYREGRYQPYENETMFNLIADIKDEVPEYVRISRVLRDIPSKFIVAGLKDSLRDIVKERMKSAGKECQCIRCREYGHRVREGRITEDPQLVRMDYNAAHGKEIFLSFEDNYKTLYGLLRLRIQPEGMKAIIRELHVFGPEVPLSEQHLLPQERSLLQERTKAAQHRGYGKALLHEAERIAHEEFSAEEIYVLSGTGAKEYYRTESGYRSKGNYMVKLL
jgi:elongator complex protein 3